YLPMIERGPRRGGSTVAYWARGELSRLHDDAAAADYPLSLHDALPIWGTRTRSSRFGPTFTSQMAGSARSIPRRCAEILNRCGRSEEHTSELQSLRQLVCRSVLEEKTNSSTITRPISFPLHPVSPMDGS